MVEVNYEEVRDMLVDVALKAGKMILEKSGRVTYDDKKNAVDLVTEVDKAVEKLVMEILRERYPDYDFMGEESYVPGKTKLQDAPTFIVDPIDGTTNFIHFFPHSCISLGLAVKKTPVVGVVYNPFSKEMYTGIKGAGSFLNGQRLPLRESGELTLQGSLCAIEWGADREGANYANKVAAFTNLSKSKQQGGGFVHGFRSVGSAALNMCSVASGTADSYWEGGCYAWDVCAGWVILEESGGIVVSGNKGDWSPAVDGRVYLAVRGAPKEQQKRYVEEYWSHLEGDLQYRE